jgi:hypothetical protein
MNIAVMDIKEVSVDILHGELADAPGFCFQRIDDVCAEGLQFLIRRIDVWCEHPVNGGLEGRLPLAKEDGHVRSHHGSDSLVRVEPANLKAKRIAVVLLRTLDIHNRQLGHRRTNRSQILFFGHRSSPTLLCNKTAFAAREEMRRRISVLEERPAIRIAGRWA